MAQTYIQELSDRFEFGKYRGCSLSEVMDCNPSYVRWVLRNIDDSIFYISRNAIDEMKKIYPDFVIDEGLAQILEQKYHSDESEEYYEDDGSESCSPYYEEPTYDRYNGSYAQDEMGYSDEDIDIIFDGDPDAYWNID